MPERPQATVVLSRRPGLLRAARRIDGTVRDLLVAIDAAEDDATLPAGTLSLGRVTRVEHGLDGAFLALGRGADGFLPAQHARHRAAPPAGAESPAARGTPIERLVQAGDAVLVQVRRPAREGDGKGPQLTTKLDLAPLAAGWGEIAARAAPARAPAILALPCLGVATVLAAWPDAATARWLVDERDLEAEARARGIAAARQPGGDDLFAAEGGAAALALALQPDVKLPGGGALAIEPTRALTAIDVDAGDRLSGNRGEGGGPKATLALDRAAAVETARQIRLRNIGGTIVVDFLALAAKADRAEVADALRAEAAGDPAEVAVGAMAASGLMVLTRARRMPSLAEQLGAPCAACAGTGRVVAPLLAALEALQRLRIEALAAPARRPVLVAGPAVAGLLAGRLAGARRAVEATLGMTIEIETAADMPPERWEARMRERSKRADR